MLFYVINIITTKVKRSQILNIILLIFILKSIFIFINFINFIGIECNQSLEIIFVYFMMS